MSIRKRVFFDFFLSARVTSCIFQQFDVNNEFDVNNATIRARWKLIDFHLRNARNFHARILSRRKTGLSDQQHRSGCQFFERLRRTFPRGISAWRTKTLRRVAPSRERPEYYTMGHVRRLVWSVNQSSGESSACKKKKSEKCMWRDSHVAIFPRAARRDDGVCIISSIGFVLSGRWPTPPRQSTHVRVHIHARTPLHPVDRPTALLSLPSNVSADEHFSNIRCFCLFLSLSHPRALFHSPSLWFRHDGIDRLSV